MASEVEKLLETRTENDGVLRVERWPDGLVLWVGGEIVWKQWERTRPKEWKACNADEMWKIIICARDIYDTQNLISTLIYILTEAGPDTGTRLDLIRRMSGKDIIRALETHVEKSKASIENSLRRAK